MSNLVPGQYREVAVASVDFALSADRLQRHFFGREVYRRTRYVVVRHGDATAVVEIVKSTGSEIMAVVTGVAVLALPDSCVFVAAPDADTGVPSSLAAVALSVGGARCVVVEGRYHHVNFILDPAPARVRVVDVIPPGPPKLVDQVTRVLALADDLPAIELVPDVVDLADLAREHPAARYLLPCRGSGFAARSSSSTEVAFLDERPPRQDWTLIGCARSRQLHQWFYRDLPPTVEMCPRVLAAASPTALVTLTKCCLLEDRVVEDLADGGGDTVVVPWGASLQQVRQGLAAAAAFASRTSRPEGEPTWAPA